MLLFPPPPPCPPWCRTVHDADWDDVTPYAVTRTCQRVVIVDAGVGEVHELTLERFASVEAGGVQVDRPIIRGYGECTVMIAQAAALSDTLRRLVDLIDEPVLVA